MNVHQIIKKAIERLKKEGKELTPDYYAEAFCIEAKKAGIISQDCNQIEKYIASFDKGLQKEIKEYRIDTTAKLIRFVISKLNRMQPSQCAKQLDSSTTLLKRVLQVSQMLHNKEVIHLANHTLDATKDGVKLDQMDHLNQSWTNFLTLYDDTFLEKLKPLGTIDSDDLKGSIDKFTSVGSGEAVVKPSLSSGNKKELDVVASLLVSSLVPSIASSVNDSIAVLSDTLRMDPSLVTSKSIEKDVKDAIALRIALDKNSLKEMLQTLDNIVDKLSVQLIKLIENTDESNAEIQEIKRDLEQYEQSKEVDFKSAHKKLYHIAVSLEEKTKNLSTDLKEHSAEVLSMSKRIIVLEKELKAAQDASREDFLTKLYNKRALEEFFKVKEGEFERYQRNFCIAMFDLDLFKKVNDTYGHEAGDEVLKGFSKILKKLARSVDVVGRYGGEEFIAILSDTDLKGAVLFAKKVNHQVSKSKLMYKGEHIKLTVSAGVAQRKDLPSLKATINSADQRLYDAKENGRNRVEPNT